MGYIDVPKEITDKAERQLYNFNGTHDILEDSPYIAISPGYFPPFDYVEESPEVFKNNVTLALFLLDDIDTENKTLLDIACGKGLSAYSYSKYLNIKSFYGIDIIEKAVNFCKNNYSGQFDLMNLNSISYENNMFDIITSIDSLCGIVINDNDFIKNIYRMLKPGGIFTHFDLKMPGTYNQLFKDVFIKNSITDITQNVLDSCEFVLENIDTLNLSDKQKHLFLYGYTTNRNDILSGNKYYKYVGFKE